MRHLFSLWLAGVASSLFLVACGGDSGSNFTTVSKLSNADMEVDTYSELPSCTEKREGKIAYVADQGQGYVCDSDKWVEDDAVEVYSSSSIGNAPGPKSSESFVPQKGVGTLKDSRDGHIYKTVKIGDQVWMAENLNFATNGAYVNSECDTCGRYYTWAATMDSVAIYSLNSKDCGNHKLCTVKNPARGICPEGWHIPTRGEWENLYSSMGRSPYAMQALGYNLWSEATDAYGFSAIPAGAYSNGTSGDFRFIGQSAYFWSATESADYRAYYLHVDIDSAFLFDGLYTSISGKSYCLSVRCLQDSDDTVDVVSSSSSWNTNLSSSSVSSDTKENGEELFKKTFYYYYHQEGKRDSLGNCDYGKISAVSPSVRVTIMIDSTGMAFLNVDGDRYYYQQSEYDELHDIEFGSYFIFYEDGDTLTIYEDGNMVLRGSLSCTYYSKW